MNPQEDDGDARRLQACQKKTSIQEDGKHLGNLSMNVAGMRISHQQNDQGLVTEVTCAFKEAGN